MAAREPIHRSETFPGEVARTDRAFQLVPPIEAPSRFADMLAVVVAVLLVAGGAFLAWTLFVP